MVDTLAWGIVRDFRDYKKYSWKSNYLLPKTDWITIENVSVEIAKCMWHISIVCVFIDHASYIMSSCWAICHLAVRYNPLLVFACGQSLDQIYLLRFWNKLSILVNQTVLVSLGFESKIPSAIRLGKRGHIKNYRNNHYKWYNHHVILSHLLLGKEK